ncbi:MAG: efflux RND transporter permease subunit, partial [Planctomycetota bacterium]
MKEVIGRILSRPVGVLVASVAAVVMGVLSFKNIPVQMMPSGFEARHITVRTRLRDSSTEEAERFVAIPIEEGLGTVAGIESIRSRCSRDGVRISIELKKDADPVVVERDVRDRVARVEADMPEDVDRLRVRREGSNDRPSVFFACIADLDRVELSDFMEDVILPRVESLDGVARSNAWGLLKRAVRIQLDPEEVARRNLDLRELLRRLRGDNLSSDLGDLRDGERTAFLRASMEFDSIEEIRDFPVLEGLRLGQLAKVGIIPSLDEGWSRYNANAVIVGTIYKTAGANTVEVSHRVRDLFQDILDEHPEIPELQLRAFFDEGKEIENALYTLYKNALYGGVLAVLILLAFFRKLRMTLLVAAALPLSLTIAITVHYLGGGSLNVLSMMGLTIAVGMLIDNAIVVVESILRRREFGETPRQAAARGTGEVALAIVTATLTTIVVFLPAIFLSGDTNARNFLMALGGPIAFALLASLAVALVLVPLGSIYLRRHRVSRAEGRGGAMGGAHPRYARFLRAALRHRFAVVVVGLLVCVSMGFPLGRVSRKGAMSHGGGPVRIFVRFPRHYTLSDADQVVRQYEQFVLGIQEEQEIDGIYARFDRRGGMVMIWRTRESTKPRDEMRDTVEEGWPDIPGIWTSLQTAGEEGTTKVSLEGEDPGELERTMDLIQQRLERLPSVSEIRRDQEAGFQELRVTVDPEALARGQVVPQLIRGMIGWVLRGARLRDFRAEGRDLPVLLELDPDQAVEVKDLGALLIPTDRGMKPLATLSRLGIHDAPA